jgi:hypothetical protein
LKSQNKEFDENKIIENAKKDGKEINEEEVKNFVSASDLGEE